MGESAMGEHGRTRAPWSGGLAVLAAVLAGLLAVPVAAAQAAPGDPPFSVDEEELAAALTCDELTHPDREPVLLVHPTAVRGDESFGWNVLPVLRARGFDVCWVTYPDRGLGDQQVAAEYVAHAVQTIAAEAGGPVDLVGHSQGGSMPRWAITFWPSVREAVDDHVALGAPHHGTTVADGLVSAGGPRPAATWQFRTDSAFVAALDAGDPTPGTVDWTNLYTRLDELARPVDPVPTSALEHGQGNPRVANVLLQDACPARLVDHLTIGTLDRLAFELTVDALVHEGPADPSRLALGPLCTVPTLLVEEPGQLTRLPGILVESLRTGLPDLHLADAEPPVRPYAADRAG